MSTKLLRSGTLLKINQKTYLMVRLLDGGMWQLEDTATKRISEISEQDLLKLYATGDLKLVCLDHHKTFIALQANPNKVELSARAKVKYAYVKATLGLPASSTLLIPVIEQTWRNLGCPGKAPHFSTVCRWRNLYRDGSRSAIRLVDQCHKKGNRKPRFPNEVLEIVEAEIDRLYLTPERPTVQDIVDQAVLAVSRENKLLPPSLQLPMPTVRLVRSLIDSIPAYDRYAARYGRDAANNRFRAVNAHRTTNFPLERAEIDHSPIDVMVVDDLSGLPLGRPYLTICIEDFTRSILGHHISFSAPSYMSVAKCLTHAFTPKTNLKSEYPSVVNDWSAFGMMQELVVDNGMEFHSESLENACLLLGIEIHYSARKTPWFKGKVERVIGSLNRGVAHGVDGTTFSNIFEKGDYNPNENAVIRLSTLKEAINIWIVDYYHQKPHRALKTSPSKAWANSICLSDIPLVEDRSVLEAIVGKSLQRKLSHKGVEYNSLYYNSPELTQLRRRYGDKLDVEIRVNPEDIGEIFVISEDKQIFKVPAIAKEYASGLTEWQHKFLRRYAGTELNKYDDPTGWLEAKEKVRRLFAADKKWKKGLDRKARAEKRAEATSKKTQEASRQSEIPLKEIAAPIEVTTTVAPEPVVDLTSVEIRSTKRFGVIQQDRCAFLSPNLE